MHGAVLQRLSVGTLIPFLDLTSWEVMLEPAFTSASILFFFFAGLAWSTWKTCNKITVERKIPSHPSEVPFYAISFLQKWVELLKPKDQIRVEKIMEII